MAKTTTSTDDRIPHRDLLVMAIALHGSSSEAMRSNSVTASGRTILHQTLEWAGLWNEPRRRALYCEMNDSTVDELYSTLIELSRREDALIQGFGNLGSENTPRSWPTYTGFGLTELGRNHAESLFATHPQFRSLRLNDD